MSDPTQAALDEKLRALSHAVEESRHRAREDAVREITEPIAYVIEGHGESAAKILAAAIYDGVKDAVQQTVWDLDTP